MHVTVYPVLGSMSFAYPYYFSCAASQDFEDAMLDWFATE